jgi:histone acetyltransferase (RNA polymerase elongator complex component)
MPDLPGSSVECDKQMFEDILSSTALQADQWKIYPCEITPFSTIETLYKEKKFVPYAEKNQGSFLVELLLKVKLAVHPWIRLNRVVRDIPNPSIIAGNNKTNLRYIRCVFMLAKSSYDWVFHRQILLDVMKKNDLFCRCLRCREITTKDFSAL